MFVKPLRSAVALPWVLVGVVLGGSPENTAPKETPAAPPSLAGSAWEIKYPDAPEDGLRLYRFDGRGRFHCQATRGIFLYDGSARWKVDAERFEVFVPGSDWRASGTFTTNAIRGTVIRDGKATRFEGRRLDPDDYELPPDEGEALVTVKLRQYVSYPFPELKEFEDYLKKGDDPDLKRLGKWGVAGFVFEVVAPKEYRGEYITAHHDGVLASGDPTKIAEPGKEYLMRIDKKRIGEKGFGLCSVDLRLKRPSDKRPLGPVNAGFILTR
jgi:hypothetical protein